VPAETTREKGSFHAVVAPDPNDADERKKGGDNRVEKQEKVQQVQELTEKFAGIAGAVLTGVSGLTVAESTALRRKFHQAGIQYRVVKNTLARIASQKSELKAVSDLFVGPTAIAWHPTDAVAAAKVAVEAKREIDKLEIKGGYMSGQKLDLNGVKALASLPSLNELRATLLGTINAPAAKLLAQINAPGQQLAGVLQAWKDKQEKGDKAA
jgi:large subunit ribosomal protein L10